MLGGRKYYPWTDDVGENLDLKDSHVITINSADCFPDSERV